ncbi:MAG: M15 family metallopeptidase [Treponema sp.]|nr:M15 family metallopeptidase [Treponema sp.]
MNKKLVFIAIITAIIMIYSCGSKQPVSLDSENNETEEFIYTQPVEPTRAEQVMRALHQAYPDRIETVEFRNNDWALRIKGSPIWYYYASGRILPEHRAEHFENYRPIGFYHYPAELPPWAVPSAEDAARFRNWTASRRQQSTIRRSSYFLDALWQAPTRLETENRLVRITFLGRRTRVHGGIQQSLALVEERIRAIARMDSTVQTWINNLGNLEGWGWRNIADTQARSYHSYGLAVDLLPRNLGRRQTYWLWTSQYRADWWNVPYNERYHPPAAVISAFETYGFVWGGKWPLFDTMHFEYRPEILILNGLYKP